MSSSRRLRVGIIGFGFMGRTHAAGFRAARTAGLPVELVAIAGGQDRSGAGDAEWMADADALLARSDLDAVSICTYTDTHVDLALAALRAGKHVLLEKPVALTGAAVARLAAAVLDSGLVCMPAMCMRFWPGWPWLRDRVREGTFGAPQRATFTRLAPEPAWAMDFYRDHSRSGGALFDLHIHDADFIRWTFGEVHAVESHGTLLDVETRYQTADATPVAARGAWLAEPSVPFTMRYQVELEQAEVMFDLAAAEPLRLVHGGRREPVTLPPDNAYDAEVRHFVELVLGRADAPRVTMDDAVAVTRMLEAEARSLSAGSVARLPLAR